ncbi:F-BOX PROTEIN SKIP23-LIKE [Salix viminalis]|uniref:F-BOX PROTEIN SKIP23-LIKE n=1 Tax=Salix viminalis TaxID=40686 RepID=A0A9Q0TAR7_SALVM|nr:F-BOX PROTEIN SKIP23-LIKE [Salix viminalis]
MGRVSEDMDGGGEYLEVFLEALTRSSLFWIPLRQMLNVSSDLYTSRLCLVESSGRVCSLMDLEKETWVSMRSLDDQAVFMGRNHSASVLVCDLPGCEENSVYFTDDYWERMNENDLYGGHDMGVYNLKDKSAKHFYQLDALKIQPLPCWLLPNPW